MALLALVAPPPLDYDDIEELDRSCEMIEIKRNEACNHVSERGRSWRYYRDETSCTITDGVDVEYEEVRI